MARGARIPPMGLSQFAMTSPPTGLPAVRVKVFPGLRVQPILKVSLLYDVRHQ